MSYILAGSQAHIIERMLGNGRAFYGLADQLRFGPIDEAHLSAGVACQCFDNCRMTRRADAADVARAFDDVVTEQEALLQSMWTRLTAQQQNVLRAVAANFYGLTTKKSIRRYGLPSSGGAVNTAGALIEAGFLVRASSITGYAFESPFFCRWVERETMGDLGASVPAG